MNVVTGNMSLSESDIAPDTVGADLALSRSYNTRQSTSADPMFGPG